MENIIIWLLASFLFLTNIVTLVTYWKTIKRLTDAIYQSIAKLAERYNE